jgi:Domain of unknown function (DUF4395)
MTLKELFSFPNPVNEVAARVVATGVLLLSVLTLATRRPWLLVPIAYGFVARALTGPTLSPLGQLATRVVAPRLPVPAKPVAGPPKRFAQALGAVVSVSAAFLALVFRRTTAAYTIVALMVFFATLEAGFNFCIGCKIFGLLMKAGLVPEDVCAECANIWNRPGLRDSPHAPQVERAAQP